VDGLELDRVVVDVLQLDVVVVDKLVVDKLVVDGPGRLEHLVMEMTAGPATGSDRFSRVGILIFATVATAAVTAAVAFPAALVAVKADPSTAATFLALSLLLQLFAVEVYGKGTIGVSAIAQLAAGFALGPGFGMAVALITAFTHSSRRRALGARAAFDAANWMLAAGASALAYRELAQGTDKPTLLLMSATAAGIAYTAINNGLLCVAMALHEHLSPREVWVERFHWARYHFLAFGAVALTLTLANDKMGLTGVVAFSLTPILMVVSLRSYVARTHEDQRQMRNAHRDTIAALSRSMEAKDFATGGHTERVAEIAGALAKRLGYEGEDLEAIEIGALLHDIGKIGVPESILHKPYPLDSDEMKVIRRHPVISEFILADTSLHPIVRQIARSSHERIDGKGYPDSIPGDDIPLPARIVFVADAFDAITSDRPYRRAESVQAALNELRKHAGTQFCPLVVTELERVYKEEPLLLTRATVHVLPVAGLQDADVAAHAVRR
jgi:putative nucleotidyltransferase with HDIG domain